MNGNTAPAASPKIGDKMPDGTIYAGISPDTNKPFYAMADDAPMTMEFEKAQKYATRINGYGHGDWRLPTKAELAVLFENRIAIGRFEVDGSYPAGWYWSSSESPHWGVWCQCFSNGVQCNHLKVDHSSVRCVR